MKTIIIATLLGLFLSPPAFASSADYAQQMRSNSNAASGYVYVNRLDAPANTNPVSANSSAADRLSSQL
ncbi:hypothetical protein [Pantoea sp.]|uniref:hypothetical protein n=1 Tax=Pantoea sp. TaxID=69393 RepID=UPI0031D0708F